MKRMSSLGLRLFSILLLLVLIYIGGVMVFTKGFLLSRLVVEKNSSCHVDFASHTDRHGGEGCWMHKRYKKAILIIIDALRFDFSTYNTSLSMSEALPYQNKLTVMHELLTTKPMNTRLYKFIADPPTTTMQRLKGLTTGSLPTFVDAGSNFASAEINEDNLIDQLVNLGKKIVFMGDDTWEALFPRRFHKSYPFLSTNVKDLHTVDNGVIKHLLPEVKRSGWDVVIGHFLGVDHCGHRFGPDHPAMGEKLTQMNGVLRSLTKSLDEDTILFVLGDHGMTRTGDHGGDSVDEVEAALFVYSPSQITASPAQKGNFPTVSQIDMVPTLALLLGAPIPHSSLGTVITDLFNHCPSWKTQGNRIKQVFHSVKALHLNAHQVQDYLTSYSQISHDFPRQKFLYLQQMFERAESDLQALVTQIYTNPKSDPNVLARLVSLEKEYTEYLNQVKQECQEIWAKFDVNAIVLGIIITAAILMACAYIITQLPSGIEDVPVFLYAICAGLVWLCIYFGVLIILDMKTMGFVFSLAIGVVLIFVVVLVLVKSSGANENNEPAVEQDTRPVPTNSYNYALTLTSLLVCVMYILSSFSNSFVVSEDQVTSFLSQSLVWMVFIGISQSATKCPTQKKTKNNNFDILYALTSPKGLLFVCTFAVSLLIRLSHNFRACREEQWYCDVSIFVLPLGSLIDNFAHFKNFRYVFSVLCPVTVTVLSYYWLKKQGNLMGHSAGILCVKYVVPLSTVSTCLYWALQALPQSMFDALPLWQQIVFPQIVYGCILIIAFSILYNPMCVHLIPVNGKDMLASVNSSSPKDVIQNVYHHVKLNWKQHFQSSSSDEKPPTVYGLGTVYSSAFIVLLIAVMHLLSLLLGDGLAPGLVIGFFSAALLLELHAHYTVLCCGTTSIDVPISSVAAWFLLSSQYFYGTGHQTTMPNIRWDAAFVGFHGDWNYQVLPAIFMFLSTFSSQVLFALALPLLLIWPVTRRNAILNLHCKKSSDSPLMEMEVHQREPEVHTAMFKLTITYMILSCAKVFGSMCAAGLLRRHLMVWKIFAPRFVFDSACSIVTCASLLLVNLFMFRVQSAVNQWVQRLENNK